MTGYAQVGISGLSKVQVWMQPESAEWPADDPYFTTAPWIDAEILPPPKTWGGELPDDKIPAETLGFDAAGQPQDVADAAGKVHWAALLARPARRRVHAPLAARSTRKARPADAAPVPQVGPCGD